MIFVSAIAEHFICFLVSKGYIENGYCVNKKKLKDVFKDEYLPLYHVRMRPHEILVCLVINKFVRREKKNKSEIVFFSASKVEEIVSRHRSSRQGKMKITKWFGNTWGVHVVRSPNFFCREWKNIET